MRSDGGSVLSLIRLNAAPSSLVSAVQVKVEEVETPVNFPDNQLISLSEVKKEEEENLEVPEQSSWESVDYPTAKEAPIADEDDDDEEHSFT